jgi:hypothetical protein
MRRREFVLATAVALIVAACGPVPAAVSPRILPTAAAATQLAEGLGITCSPSGPGPAFPPRRLAETGAAHRESDAGAEALRSYLASLHGAGSGAPSWIRIAQDAERLEFLGRQLNGTFVYVRFVRRVGRWALDEHGGCALRVALPAGSGPVTWSLDPAGGPHDRSTELRLLLHGFPCDPGDPPLEHIDEPVVVTTGSAVTITVIGHDCSAEQYCEGPTPVAVPLPDELRKRAILDGGVYPPAPVGTARPT